MSQSTTSALERLRMYLRPPGKGIYARNSGGAPANRLLQALYGCEGAFPAQSAWEDSLQRLRRVKTFLMGVPSDAGSGVQRGANFGPIGVREAFLKSFGPYPKQIVDVGDVFCVPQLLHDEMLSEFQKQSTRREIYAGRSEISAGLPVSPLSVAEEALGALYELNHDARIFMIGGDHSVTWPAVLWCHRRFGKEFGIVHFDGQTDLMEQRLGVKYCFSTWAYHALALVKPRGLLQVGVRDSQESKDFWETQYPVAQIWADEVPGREAEWIVKIAQHFKSLGLKRLYLSNDVQGTEAFESGSEALTPGLSPAFVQRCVRHLAKEFEIIGGDIVEVAPPVSEDSDFSAEKTCLLAAVYLKTLFESSID